MSVNASKRRQWPDRPFQACTHHENHRYGIVDNLVDLRGFPSIACQPDVESVKNQASLQKTAHARFVVDDKDSRSRMELSILRCKARLGAINGSFRTQFARRLE